MCYNNATCLVGFTDKGYKCMCPPGYTGDHCEKDVNECSTKTHNCDVNAECNNTEGSFNCSCKIGFNGDGKKCAGHGKKLSGKKLEEKLQSSAKRDERRRLREKLRVEAQDKLREQLRQEVAAKKQKINEPGIQVEDIGIENIFDTDVETGVATQAEEFDYLFVTAEKPFEENWSAGDDEKVAFYTGISGFDVLMTVFRHVSPHVNRKSMTLSKFQEFILTLMTLKLNAPMQDLAYRFGVSRSTVSRIFSSVDDCYGL
ncbi:Protein HEG-like 1 [Stylophora pistillata]|uniref:Protein HEG-like 1 n=1 Tax=Stylophora pistillata TaxID=50429 RepID=A0A2B4RAZ0_STYPI|nr:Protein HEG-like 1 [Stylophora pistillata]